MRQNRRHARSHGRALHDRCVAGGDAGDVRDRVRRSWRADSRRDTQVASAGPGLIGERHAGERNHGQRNPQTGWHESPFHDFLRHNSPGFRTHLEPLPRGKDRMTHRSYRRVFAVGLLALATAVWSGGAVDAQGRVKRPLTYDVYDSWRAIQGTRLSDDGQWLAFALTSQGEDGELVVRNLKTNQEFKTPRGTNPTFTPDAKFVVFTIVPTKA